LTKFVGRKTLAPHTEAIMQSRLAGSMFVHNAPTLLCHIGIIKVVASVTTQKINRKP
jgi:hypothetical protein